MKVLVIFLLKSSNCSIHPPITIQKTESTTNISFVYSENFQNCWESASGGITFWQSNKNLGVLRLCRETQHVHDMFQKVALLEIREVPF